MYNIDFYENARGDCEVRAFLETLRRKAASNKDARIQYGQAARCIQLLQDNGTNLPTDVAKHIQGDIWELRPGKNRIFFFGYHDDTFVLLHHFRKRTEKTPTRQIKQAIAEMNNYKLERGLL